MRRAGCYASASASQSAAANSADELGRMCDEQVDQPGRVYEYFAADGSRIAKRNPTLHQPAGCQSADVELARGLAPAGLNGTQLDDSAGSNRHVGAGFRKATLTSPWPGSGAQVSREAGD